jgi:hypothetical protein
LAQAPFYQGKTITVIAGQEPGGLGDLRLKSILPYFKKHIPGQPNIVTEYMPGGGGRKAANYIYRTARPDGLTLGYPPGGFVRAAALNEPGVDYELDKFSFYGYGRIRGPLCVSHQTGVQSRHIGSSPRQLGSTNWRAIGGPRDPYARPIVRVYSCA